MFILLTVHPSTVRIILILITWRVQLGMTIYPFLSLDVIYGRSRNRMLKSLD